MNKRLFIIIGGVVFIVVAIVVILLTGKKDGQTTNKTLTIWSPFDEAKTYQDLSADFLASNAGVKIDFKYVEASDSKDYEAKVVNDIANGNGPDIWLVRNDWIPKHAEKSAPATAKDKSKSAIDSAKAVITPALVDLNTYQGKLYGLPISADSLAIIYNNGLLSSAAGRANNNDQITTLENMPTTWSELKKFAQVFNNVKADNGTNSAIALGTVSNAIAPVDVLSAFLLQSGVSLFDDSFKTVEFNLAKFKDGQPNVPAIEALDFYTSFARSGQANQSWSVNSGDPTQAFLDQKTAALIGYHSTLQKIIDTKPKFDVKIGPLVQKDSTKDRIDYAVTWSHIVNAKSNQTDLAWQYLWYLSDRSIQDQYAEATHKIVAYSRSGSEIPDSLVSSSDVTVFRSQFITAGKIVKPEWQSVDEILQDSINQVVINNQSFQTTVDSAASRLKTLLKQ